MRNIIFSLVASIVFVGLSSVRIGAAEKKEWVELGSREVDFKQDHDMIAVGKKKGEFTHIRFKVEDGNLIMEKIVVTFHDGEKFKPTTKAEFKEGSRSADIDLPGKGRIIDKVDFVYHSEDRHDPATIVLYGKED